MDLLRDIRVLEFAVLLNGDICGMLLGDLGADVIKIEVPGMGDHIRDISVQLAPRVSLSHLQVNRNKRSIALDLRDAEDMKVFWRLHEQADVFVDGHAGGAADRLGIGYQDQRRRNPGIVYCQITGFGSTGPYAGIPTHGRLQSALAGAIPIRRGPDGRIDPEAGPDGVTVASAATPAATYGALAITAALVARVRTGMGTYLDVAGSDAVIAQSWSTALNAVNLDRVTASGDGSVTLDHGGPGGSSAKYNYYETLDGEVIAFACAERKFWNSFCDNVGRPDLRDDADTPGNDFDWGSDVQLRDQVAEIFAQRSQRDWIDFAIAHRLPVGPMNRPSQLARDPHLAQRQIFYEEEHPVVGRFTTIGSPIVVAGQPFEVRIPAASVGEHTAEILADLDRRSPS